MHNLFFAFIKNNNLRKTFSVDLFSKVLITDGFKMKITFLCSGDSRRLRNATLRAAFNVYLNICGFRTPQSAGERGLLLCMHCRPKV